MCLRAPTTTFPVASWHSTSWDVAGQTTSPSCVLGSTVYWLLSTETALSGFFESALCDGASYSASLEYGTVCARSMRSCATAIAAERCLDSPTRWRLEPIEPRT